MNKLPIFFTLEPTGYTGGREYLRMVHKILSNHAKIYYLPDYKRKFKIRRWRKLKHLFLIFWKIPYPRKNTYYIWDDLSIIFFRKKMLKKTIYIFHHYDPKEADSHPFEKYLWMLMFKKIKNCKQVICVSPYWKFFLQKKNISPKIIYNSFDTNLIKKTLRYDKNKIKREFKLQRNKIYIYLGKGSHWKGAIEIYKILKGGGNLEFIITGDNTLKIPINYFNEPKYENYLKIISVCDIAIFNSTLLEGWSRVASEAILLKLPCFINPVAGLGDLAELTKQPPIPKNINIKKIINRVNSDKNDSEYSSSIIMKFDLKYFKNEWIKTINELVA